MLSPEEISLAAQLAACLEISGWPKPGNVHRTADFPDTTFEEFLAGSVALGPAVRASAERGFLAGEGGIDLEDIGVGELVKRSVSDIKRWHKGGNTHLGISLLFIPTAAAAGYLVARDEEINPNSIKRAFLEVVKFTTVEDAIHGYEAILMASSAALGRLDVVDAPDLSDEDFVSRIRDKGVTLFDAMIVSSKWDNVAREWATGLQISAGLGVKTFLKVYNEFKSVNVATVHTYLSILAKYPDTFVARKVGSRHERDITKAVRIGMETSLWISSRAKEILRAGGLTTEEGRRMIFELDDVLRREQLNPGTSADLTANSIYLAVLSGFRP